MKTLCLLLATAFSVAFAHASAIKVVGDLDWEITEPRCTFTMDGGIQNVSPSGTSGTLKLVLWATAAPYPSQGYPVAEYVLGQIGAGYQFSDFTVRTKPSIPSITGTYHFTVSILEFTGSSWATRAYVPTGTKVLKGGDFATQKTWSLPKSKVTKPAKELKNRNKITLTPAATEELNLLPAPSRKPTIITIRAGENARITNASKSHSAKYTYAVKKGPYNKNRVSSGRLSITHSTGNDETAISKSSIVLYFHAAGSGTYKATEQDYFGKIVTWGTFKMQ